MAHEQARTSECRSVLTELLSFAVGEAAPDLACRLIRRHHSIGAILHLAANPDAAALEADVVALQLLKTTRRFFLSSLWAEASSAPFANARAVVDYLRAAMAHGTYETARVLFVDRRNRLVADEEVATGTAYDVALPIRHILKRAVLHDATGIFLAHNHPGGDPAPSRRDRAATARLEAAAAVLGIKLHDHLIFAPSGWTSFQALGLLRGSA